MTREQMLEKALRRLTEAVAPAVAVLSRAQEVAPELRAQLADAEVLILGPVRAALSPSPSEAPALCDECGHQFRGHHGLMGVCSIENCSCNYGRASPSEGAPIKTMDLQMWQDRGWGHVTQDSRELAATLGPAPKPLSPRMSPFEHDVTGSPPGVTVINATKVLSYGQQVPGVHMDWSGTTGTDAGRSAEPAPRETAREWLLKDEAPPGVLAWDRPLEPRYTREQVHDALIRAGRVEEGMRLEVPAFWRALEGKQ